MAIKYHSGEIEYTPKDLSDPNIIDVEWLDADGTPLAKKNINGTTFSDIRYGEKVKVKVTFDKKPTNKIVSFNIKSNIPGVQYTGKDIPSLEANETEAISKAFVLPITLYRDNFEDYDYIAFKTGVKKPQELYIEVNRTNKFDKEDKHKLKPYTYFRNYEELLGLFSTSDSGDKDFKDNYENKFIDLNSSIKSIVDKFITDIADINLTEVTEIEKLIEARAKQLWEASLNQTDDRPLYWARNKMQAYLKRHIAFKDDYEQETSRVKDGSPLATQIKRFEELSRNYTGIDFSAANGKRKMLLTGFDPFLLDSTSKHPSKDYNNILQSNPAGCVALNLHGKTIGNYYIQTMIFPVRYKDFGTGDGVVEEYIQQYIDSFSDTNGDIILTQSQGYPFIFDIEDKAGKERGGGYDNMYSGGNEYNPIDFAQLTTGNNFYYTTLPVNNMLNSPTDNLFIVNKNCTDRSDPTSTTKGSGSDYLSNEIFYRVARMRANSKPKLQTGHLHLPMLQTAEETKNILINQYKIVNSNLLTLDVNNYINSFFVKNADIINKIQ